MNEIVERVGKAIDAVQVWSRFNDWTSDRVEGLPIEICRYVADGEDEIVILKRFPASKGEDAALREVVSEMRARAAIGAMHGPTEAMTTAAALADHAGYENDAAGVYEEMWNAMIDAALAAPEE